MDKKCFACGILLNQTFSFRDKSAIDITSEFVDMYIEVPVEEWGKLLDSSDIPNLRCKYIHKLQIL